MSIDSLVLNSASTISPQVDNAMLGLVLVCGFSLIIVGGLIVIFSFRYRKDSKHSRKLKEPKSNALDWGWTIATLVVFLGLFFWGTFIYFEMHVAPKGAFEVMVVGKQWMWQFQHPSGRREINELHIPVNQPIILKMISQDVIHSLFVPDFRVKQDVLPGRYTQTWFEASKIGDYRLFCTQYCGTMHAQMIGRVKVLSDSDYDEWQKREEASNIKEQYESVQSLGAKLFSDLGCISCHVNSQLGPSLLGLYNSKVKLTTGEVIIADENYIRESILYPDAKIVEGYQPLMPTYLGRVNEEQLEQLIAYIKSLRGSGADKRSGELE